MKSKKILAAIISSILLLHGSYLFPQKAEETTDPNCIIGNEDMKKEGRFVGGFQDITTKSKMLIISVKGKNITIFFKDDTRWSWADGITDIDSLRDKKGTCISIDFKKSGSQFISDSITIMPPYKVPLDQLIDNKEMKRLMGDIPPYNNNLYILDNRPFWRYSEGYIPGAICVPLEEMNKESGLKKLPADKNAILVFYCGGPNCKFSPLGAKIAKEKYGYKNVKVYHPGHPDWMAKLNVSEVNAKFVKGQIDKEMPMILFDIRKNPKNEHIPGSVLFSTSKFNEYKNSLPVSDKAKKTTPIIIYGKDQKDDKEAFKAAELFSAIGYRYVSVLDGGFEAYKNEKGKIALNKYLNKVKFSPKLYPGQIFPDEFIAMLKKGMPANAVFIDARESNEIAENPDMTLLGAKNISLSLLPDEISNFDNDKIYYFSCTTGARAKMARDLTSAAGFKAYYIQSDIETRDGSIIFDKKNKITPDIIKKK
jgi:rhodanese-related sulfurtransferase